MEDLLKSGTDFEKSVLEISKIASQPKITKSKVDEIINKKNLKVESTEDCSLNMELSLKAVKTEDSFLPSAEELAIINKNHSLVNLEADQIRVFTFQAADNQVDRSFEHFSNTALNSMAEMAVKNKIPFITEGDRDHQWRQKNIYGAVFDASVKGGKLLYKVYIPVIEKTKPVLEAILTGIYSKLSVGFSLDIEDYVCDSCRKSIFYSDCQHYPGEKDEKGNMVTITIKNVKDNYEISGVAVPCQPDAHIRKNFGGGGSGEVHIDLVTMGSEYFNRSLVPGGCDMVQGDCEGKLSIEKSPHDTITNENTIKGSVSMEENKEVTQELEEKETEQPNAETEEKSEEKQEETQEVKVEFPPQLVEAICSLAESLEDMKGLREAVDGLKTLTESLNEKVDLVMSAPTKSLTAELNKEQLEKATAKTYFGKDEKELTEDQKYWLDKFGLGGQ